MASRRSPKGAVKQDKHQLRPSAAERGESSSAVYHKWHNCWNHRGYLWSRRSSRLGAPATTRTQPIVS